MARKQRDDEEYDAWAEYLRRCADLGPAHMLHLAALDDAVNILQRNPRDGDAYRETLAWIMGRCESKPTFGFREVCELFDLEPQIVRNMLLDHANGPRFTGPIWRSVGRKGYQIRPRPKARSKAERRREKARCA